MHIFELITKMRRLKNKSLGYNDEPINMDVKDIFKTFIFSIEMDEVKLSKERFEKLVNGIDYKIKKGHIVVKVNENGDIISFDS